MPANDIINVVNDM